MFFSKEKFVKNAPPYIRARVPETHRNILDGRKVIDSSVDYKVDGEEYYLYPIAEDWCSSSGQMSMFNIEK